MSSQNCTRKDSSVGLMVRCNLQEQERGDFEELALEDAHRIKDEYRGKYFEEVDRNLKLREELAVEKRENKVGDRVCVLVQPPTVVAQLLFPVQFHTDNKSYR